CLFHLLGFALEVFKTSSGIQSWSYPDFAYTKLFGVPLFSGFMYAAVGSYIIQAWRLFDLRIRHHPPAIIKKVLFQAILAMQPKPVYKFVYKFLDARRCRGRGGSTCKGSARAGRGSLLYRCECAAQGRQARAGRLL